jgi:transcriptional regulator with XRE-family HTH domain
MTPQQFKEKRKDLNLTQRQLAKELGLSEKNGDVYIRKVENGRCEPSGLLIKCFEFYCEINQPKQQGE